MDEPSGGTLRFSGHWILTNVFVTQADILTSALSTHTYVKASPNSGTLPYRIFPFHVQSFLLSSKFLTTAVRRPTGLRYKITLFVKKLGIYDPDVREDIKL